MKRIILYSSQTGEMIGGGQKGLLLILKYLDKTRYTPLLVCPSTGTLCKNATDLGIETFVYPMPGLRRINFFTILKLAKLLKEKRVSIIHADAPVK